MASSTLTGERRWAARRGGMTVLGKVAVPKPINLPSQRLENHGLDPNVEIVPKGTHSWGSRSPSSSSNAWGSSALSPSDGGTGSPSYLSGRPSSGGGTRPSTAGSDRGYEPLANAWSSSSRPSSASGPLTSNQTAITSSRPRSADTRPGSSQLSRFAEPLSDNSVARGALGTAENLGVAPSKKDSFSLTSGDFPTLGSEKENSTKNKDLAEHVFSHDSSSGGEPAEERTADAVAVDSGNADVKSDNTNAWRRDTSFHGREGVRPNVEQWHADPQPYPNSNIPQHFDAWHGAPLNRGPPGGGVWYRGPPGGPPFGPPVGPGGFPMEAFPYYRPQLPPGAMANAQPVPPQPSTGARGPHPNHGDVFRPPMHDAYIHPGMPIRPGFYPAPGPYEGYFGPPMAFNNNASERDIPYMGMPAGPGAYNRYPNHNTHESGYSHGRSSGYGSNNGKGFVPEQVESVHHPHDAQVPYKVLLKQREGCEGKPGEQKWDDSRAANVVDPGKGDHRRESALDNGWRRDQIKRDGDVETKRVLSGIVDQKSGASSVRLKGTEIGMKLNQSDTGLDQISEHVEHGAPFSESVSCSRDPSLIKKIEGLNAKARAADGRQDAKSVTSRDEQKNKQNFKSIRSNHHPVNESVSGFVPPQQPISNGSVTTGSFDDQISGRNKSLDLTVASGGTGIARRSAQSMHIRTDHRGKGRSNTEDTDSWRRRTQVTESNDGVLSAHVSSVVHDQDCESVEATDKSISHQGTDRESMLQASELSDTQAQRAMMRELARQRLKQREKEEEERTREQKAKALAKLEELNRRMQPGEGSSQKLETLSSTTLPNEQEELLNSAQPPVIANASTVDSVLASNSVVVAPTNEGITNRTETSAPSSNEVLPQESKKNSSEAPVVMHDQSKSRRQDCSAENVTNDVRQEYDGSRASKQKHMNYRQKQNIYLEKTSGDKVSLTTTEASKSHNTDAMPNPSVPLQVVAHEIASNSEASFPVSPSATAESSAAHPRRKNRSTRNKQKVEEAAPPTVVLPSSAPSKDTTPALEVSSEFVKPKTLESSVAAPSSVQLVPDRRGASSQQHVEQQHPTSPNEDVQVKPSGNQWKSQPSRKISGNPQANNKMMDNKFHGSSETVIWAPVRSHNNKSNVAADEGEKRSANASLPPVKGGDQQVQNTTTKNKRAEMERYVPKPVAKEMAQQGNANHSVASPVIVQIPSHETVVGSVSIPLGPESSQTTVTLQFGSIAVATRNGEGTRQIKPGKGQGSSWRQRSPAESQISSSNVNFQKSVESQQQPHNRSDTTSTVKEQPSEPIDEWTDGWTMPEEPNAPMPVSSFKDQTAAARGRRQPQKGQNRVGHNTDSVEAKIGGDNEKAHTQSWKPKSPSSSAAGQQPTKPNNNDDQKVFAAEASSRPNKRDPSSTAVGWSVPPPKDKEVAVGRTNEAYPSDQEGGRRERKVASHKGHNNNSSNPVEPPTYDQNYSSSGYRRGGGNQFNRDHQEARGEWSGNARDGNRQHNVAAGNRERPTRQSSHYEYQPVGQHNKSKGSNFEPSAKDGSHASGSRFRERVPNQARRGGGDFHGRQGGSFRVLDSNND